MNRRTVIFFPPLFTILILLIAITFWTFIVTFLDNNNYVSFFKAIAHLENYIQPIAIIMIIGVLVKNFSEESAVMLFKKACYLLVFMLLINTAVSVLCIFFDLSNILSHFVGIAAEDIERGTVWDRSVGMGRYNGIFNQPAEAGLTYSLGIFAWAYVADTKQRISMVDYLMLFSLMLGGVLSVSKAFILAGFPLFIMFWLLKIGLAHLLNLRVIAVSIFGAFIVVMVFDVWRGFNFFARLFLIKGRSLQDLIWIYSGHRFGGGEGRRGVIEQFGPVWAEAPLHGLGFAAQTTLDSAYLEFFLQGGLIALIGYLSILASIGLIGFKQYKKSREGFFLFVLIIYITSVGIGAPSFTINRFSAIFIVFLVLIYSIFYARKFEVNNKGREKCALPR